MHKRLFVGVFVACALIGLATVTLLFGFLGQEAQTVASGCDQTEATTAHNVAAVRTETSQLRINGQVPASFDASSTGDCLTNASSRATGTAAFTITAPDVATANELVLQGLKLQPASSPQTFEITDTSNIVTQLGGDDGRYFQVEYDFTDKLDCRQAYPNLCYYRPVTDPQIFAGHPINRIVVQIQNVPFSPLPQ